MIRDELLKTCENIQRQNAAIEWSGRGQNETLLSPSIYPLKTCPERPAHDPAEDCYFPGHSNHQDRQAHNLDSGWKVGRIALLLLGTSKR